MPSSGSGSEAGRSPGFGSSYGLNAGHTPFLSTGGGGYSGAYPHSYGTLNQHSSSQFSGPGVTNDEIGDWSGNRRSTIGYGGNTLSGSGSGSGSGSPDHHTGSEVGAAAVTAVH